MARTKRPSAKRLRERWVVKAGSNMICSGGPMLIRAWMAQVAELRKKRGIEVIWVTSGAIATALDRTDLVRDRSSLAQKQALSAIGQPLVMDLYNLALQVQGQLGAQVLLTYDDLTHPERHANFVQSMEQLLAWGVTPILNENDAVSTQEIQFGDNDSLSARVAATLGADRLVILTDVDGLYDSDPRKNPRAKRIGELEKVTEAHLRSAGGTAAGGTSRGTGGMYSKLTAARRASEAGVETWLVKGDLAQALLQVADRRTVGTRIARSIKKKSAHKAKRR